MVLLSLWDPPPLPYSLWSIITLWLFGVFQRLRLFSREVWRLFSSALEKILGQLCQAKIFGTHYSGLQIFLWNICWLSEDFLTLIGSFLEIIWSKIFIKQIFWIQQFWVSNHFIQWNKIFRNPCKIDQKLVEFSTKRLTPPPLWKKKEKTKNDLLAMKQILYDMGPMTLVFFHFWVGGPFSAWILV